MTPTGVPVVDRTRHGNLFINTGHGTLGWTMACGSAQIVANLVSQRASATAADRLSLVAAAAGAVC